MTEEQIEHRRQRIERIVVRSEESLFERLDLSRKTWGLNDGEMVDLVRSYDAELGNRFADWMEGNE